MAPAGDFSTDFFFIHDRVFHYLSKTRNIYFLLETRHKFGFSFLRGKRDCIGIGIKICLVVSVVLKGFMVPSTLVALLTFYFGHLYQHQQLITQGFLLLLEFAKFWGNCLFRISWSNSPIHNVFFLFLVPLDCKVVVFLTIFSFVLNPFVS